MDHDQIVIGVEELRVSCIIGILPHERRIAQELLMDLKVKVRLDSALSDGPSGLRVDYVVLAESLKKIAHEGNFQLLETLATRALDHLFDKYPIQSAWICIRKPRAMPDARCALVELERYHARQP